MADPGNNIYEQVGSRPAQEHATVTNAAPAKDDKDAYPEPDARGVYKPCRKKPAKEEKPKEDEEDVMVVKNSKKGTTKLLRGLLHWQDPRDDQWSESSSY